MRAGGRLIRDLTNWVRLRWWSFENWRKGYRWGPVQRCRWCDHTTPYHYSTCRTKAVG